MARLQTKALFFETTLPEYRIEMEPEWTLKERDHLAHDGKTYRSMKKIYLEMEDVTEYEFAMATLGSFTHWETLCKSPWFKEHIDQWRKELNLKLKAKGMRSIIKAATIDENLSFQAMKYLADNQYIDKGGKRGRPSKEEVKAELRKEAEANKVFLDDAERIGLNLN